MKTENVCTFGQLTEWVAELNQVASKGVLMLGALHRQRPAFATRFPGQVDRVRIVTDGQIAIREVPLCTGAIPWVWFIEASDIVPGSFLRRSRVDQELVPFGPPWLAYEDLDCAYRQWSATGSRPGTFFGSQL